MRFLGALGSIGLFTLTACNAPTTEHAPLLPPSAAMPLLLPMPYTAPDDAPPNSVSERFALGPDGRTAMQLSAGSETLLGIFDSTGAMVLGLGKSGEGPGELRNPTLAVFDANRVIVGDMAQPRLVTFDPNTGKARATTPLTLPVTLLASRGDRFLVAVPTSSGVVLPGWLTLDASEVQPLVFPTDSFITQHFPPASDPRTTPRATLGAWRGGVIVADGRSYSVGLYDSTGTFVRALHREVADRIPTAEMVAAFQSSAEGYRGPDGKGRDPARIADEVAAYRRSTLPHFYHTVPIIDDRVGRIWVVGVEGDSAFADIFTPTAHLGHIGISCSGFGGRWALNGEWLALVCGAPERSDRVAVMQLYRIVERE
jgi:hypothetical protein